jgi:FkbM family methyltransferase
MASPRGFLMVVQILVLQLCSGIRCSLALKLSQLNQMRKNTQHLDNVKLIHGGLWSKPTRLTVQYPQAEKYAVRVIEDDNGTIEAHSIDSIMQQQGWDWIDVVKLDVEGSEVQILSADNNRWIDKIGILIIELHQDFAPESARILFEAFADQSFHLSWRGENLVLRRIQTRALADVLEGG